MNFLNIRKSFIDKHLYIYATLRHFSLDLRTCINSKKIRFFISVAKNCHLFRYITEFSNLEVSSLSLRRLEGDSLDSHRIHYPESRVFLTRVHIPKRACQGLSPTSIMFRNNCEITQGIYKTAYRKNTYRDRDTNRDTL